MYILLLKYVKPLEQVDQLLEGHIEYLDKNYKDSKFIFSGRRNPRVGGVILADVDSESEVKQIISEDPFLIHRVAEYEIIEFTPTKYDPRFACFVDQPTK